MIYAAALLTGLAALWLMLAPSWGDWRALSLGAVGVVSVLLLARRLGAADREAAPYVRLPGLAMLALSRAGATARDAWRVMRAALAADVTLNPALVRVKTREASDLARASFANAISAAPGAVVVETDADGFLLHVIDEDSFDAPGLAALEARVIAAVDGSAPG